MEGLFQLQLSLWRLGNNAFSVPMANRCPSSVNPLGARLGAARKARTGADDEPRAQTSQRDGSVRPLAIGSGHSRAQQSLKQPESTASAERLVWHRLSIETM